MDEEDLKKRTKRFGLRIMKLVAALPNTPQGKDSGRPACKSRDLGRRQLQGSMPRALKGRVYCQTRCCGGRADESGYWLEMIIDGGLMKAKLVTSLLTEANELVAIMTSSRLTVHRKQLAEKRNAKLMIKSKIKNQKSKI